MHGVTAAKLEVAITGIQTLIAPTGTQRIIDHFSRDAVRVFSRHSSFFLAKGPSRRRGGVKTRQGLSLHTLGAKSAVVTRGRRIILCAVLFSPC
jgi:hypothetical protein